MNTSVTETKKATNITLSVDVLREAKTLGINISQACDQYLRQLVAHESARRWRSEHAEFITAYNAEVERDGLPLETWRAF